MTENPGSVFFEVNNLRTYFFTREGATKAVDGISFKLREGDALGLVGESGCGKSTTALAIMGLVPRPGRTVSGSICLEGIDLLQLKEQEFRRNYRWKRISMVFQGSMNALNPVFKVGDQITEAIKLHERVSDQQAKSRARELIELIGIDADRADNYPHELSGGMKQRMMIAMALACNPELVIADEPTTALDVIVQAQVLRLLGDLRQKLRLSMILISHDLSVVAETCNKVAIMYAGKIVEIGDAVQVYTKPSHPYTQGLMSAFPNLVSEKKELVSIPGQPPDLRSPPSGCRFHPRCPYVFDRCRKEEPTYTRTGEGNYAACWMLNSG